VRQTALLQPVVRVVLPVLCNWVLGGTSADPTHTPELQQTPHTPLNCWGSALLTFSEKCQCLQLYRKAIAPQDFFTPLWSSPLVFCLGKWPQATRTVEADNIGWRFTGLCSIRQWGCNGVPFPEVPWTSHQQCLGFPPNKWLSKD
jgi:hypothetical protein